MKAELSVPGRVNLIGEHIDYHNLPVLPMAIGRRICISFRPREDCRIRVTSSPFGLREFEWTPALEPGPPGDWANYLKAAAQAVRVHWGLDRGIEATISSDLPAAAGLASSSALLTGFTLALLRAHGISASFEELMEVLPEAEHFIGTRGGAMDHAAVLAARPGCALLVRFAPLRISHIPVPRDWAFLVAHSITTAEKSAALLEEYNARRQAGARALARADLASRLPDGEERRAYLHVTGEARRVSEAVEALKAGDARRFGELLNASHLSLRDLLRVSSPALDELVETAREAGAWGARLTGAGFGGCAIVFSARSDRKRIAAELVKRYYSRRAGFEADKHLIAVEASAGALSPQAADNPGQG
jgi:galactokinase